MPTQEEIEARDYVVAVRRGEESIGKQVRKAFRIEGIKEIRKNLAKLMNGMVGAEAKEVYHRAGEVVHAEMVKRVPVRTGKLRSAIFLSDGDPNKPDVLIGVNTRKVEYARTIEYGLEKITLNIQSSAPREHTAYRAAHPFVRPAIAASQLEVSRILTFGLKGIIARHTK